MAQAAAERRSITAAGRRRRANAIRALSIDAVEAAQSGHPGAPLGMADIAEVLWHDHLRHNPANPQWPDRDRFVLSNGHASMLLYALLHLTGYALPLDELRRFRQLGSQTPGHPEYGETPGVETTTGPLGQGLANAVGMAMAEQMLAARFNKPDMRIVDHFTYVFLGDGCLMEGISHEACSFAGRLGLGKLICFYDDNGISIDGPVRGWFADDTPKRFEAYGWQVIGGVDGHDSDAIETAIAAARAEAGRPTLICCRTVIGFGAPNKAGHHDTHGAPLGEAEARDAKRNLGCETGAFALPADLREEWLALDRGRQLEQEWQRRFAAYRGKYPHDAAEFERRLAAQPRPELDAAFDRWIAELTETRPGWATRKSSGKTLEAVAGAVPELISGSADLTGSNNTRWSTARTYEPAAPDGNYVHWGVREFAMCAAANGLMLHGGLRPVVGTFLVFSDYARNAIRLAALMRISTIFVLTHDSIGLGEDGPTHQPIEHAASLRLIPNLDVWRPADALETAVAWRCALLSRERPSCLLLTRQGLPAQTREGDAAEHIARGAYVLVDCSGTPDCLLIASGSEVAPTVEAGRRLAAQGIATRVVSMPNPGRFDRQPESYRARVLPDDVDCRVAVEAGAPQTWWQYVGRRGDVVGLERFGASGPGEAVFASLGFTADAIAGRVRRLVARHHGEKH